MLSITLKTLPAVLALLLLSSPATVLSAPVNTIDRRQSNWDASGATHAGSNIDAGIPGGPSYNNNDFFSNEYSKSHGHSNPGNPSNSQSGHTEAGSNTNVGIPGGPYVNLGNYFDNTYSKTETYTPPPPPPPPSTPEVPPQQEEVPTPSLPLPPPPTSTPPTVNEYTPVPVPSPPAETPSDIPVPPEFVPEEPEEVGACIVPELEYVPETEPEIVHEPQDLEKPEISPVQGCSCA